MNKKQIYEFNRDDTKALKGIAIIMMLLHHLAGFTDRYPMGFEKFNGSKWFIEEGFLTRLAFNMNFCVALFFFFGGYGIYKRLEKGSFNLTSSILGLLKKYWKIFFIFVPVGFIFFSRKGENISALASRYNFNTIRELITILISNFTLLSDSANSEWWFMKTYICALLMGTVYFKLTKKLNSLSGEIMIIFLIDIIFRSVLPNLSAVTGLGGLSGNMFFRRFCIEASSSSPFFAGIAFAKYDVLARLKKILGNIPFTPVIGLAGAFIVIWCRCFIVASELDLIYAPLFIVSLSVFFDYLKPIKLLFGILGKHSTNMWLIHSFYCYYFLEVTKIVYSTHNVWIDLVILITLSFFSSVLVDLFYRYFFKGISFIQNKFNKITDQAETNTDAKNIKATPHRDSASDTKSDFSADCTEILQTY